MHVAVTLNIGNHLKRWNGSRLFRYEGEDLLVLVLTFPKASRWRSQKLLFRRESFV